MNRGKLKTLLKQLIDERGDNVFTEIEYEQALYSGLLAVVDKMDMYRIETTIQRYTLGIQPNTTIVNLPTDFRIIRACSILRDNNRIPINIVQYLDLAVRGNRAYDAYVLDKTLNFTVPLSDSFVLEIFYSPTFVDLATDDQSWDIPENAQILIAYEAAQTMLVSENSKPINELLDSRWAAFISAMSDRVTTGPRTVRIV